MLLKFSLTGQICLYYFIFIKIISDLVLDQVPGFKSNNSGDSHFHLLSQSLRTSLEKEVRQKEGEWIVKEPLLSLRHSRWQVALTILRALNFKGSKKSCWDNEGGLAHCLYPAWMLSGCTRCLEITGAGGGYPYNDELRNFNNEK